MPVPVIGIGGQVGAVDRDRIALVAIAVAVRVSHGAAGIGERRAVVVDVISVGHRPRVATHGLGFRQLPIGIIVGIAVGRVAVGGTGQAAGTVIGTGNAGRAIAPSVAGIAVAIIINARPNLAGTRGVGDHVAIPIVGVSFHRPIRVLQRQFPVEAVVRIRIGLAVGILDRQKVVGVVISIEGGFTLGRGRTCHTVSAVVNIGKDGSILARGAGDVADSIVAMANVSVGSAAISIGLEGDAVAAIIIKRPAVSPAIGHVGDLVNAVVGVIRRGGI